MNSRSKKTISDSGKDRAPQVIQSGPFGIGIVVAFYGAWFAYVWLRVQLAAGYYHTAPTFLSRYSFFKPFLGIPGGLLEYCAAFVPHWIQTDLAGAFATTVLTVLIYGTTRTVVRRFAGGNWLLLALTPSFLWLCLVERVDGSAWRVGLGLVAALVAAIAHLQLPARPTAFRIAGAWGLATVVLYLAGVWPAVLLVVLTAMFEFLRGRMPIAVGCLASGVIIPICFFWLDLPKPATVLMPWALGWPLILTAMIYGFLPITILGVAASRRFGVVEVWNAQMPRTVRWAALVLFLGGGWGLVIGSYHEADWASARIDFASSRGQFEQVLSVAAQPEVTQLDVASEVRLHRALFRTGRLSEDLFAFRNQTRWRLMPSMRGGLASCRAQSETLFELGLVNDAEHMTHEALEAEGLRPDLLRRLAQINVLKGRPKAATIFLNVLRQVPFAGPVGADVKSAAEWATGESLSQIRACSLSGDWPHAALPPDELLEQLLVANPKNRMAGEYLLIHYLLEKDLERFMYQLKLSDNFGLERLSRHYEEAVLLYERGHELPTEVKRYRIRSETSRRYQEFTAALKQQAGQNRGGPWVAPEAFGDTFWFYFYNGAGPARGGNASNP